MRPQQANKPKNLKEVDKQLSQISGYAKQVIFALTVNQLRELGAFIIKDIRKLKHDELAQSIYDAGQVFKERRKIELNDKVSVNSNLSELEQFLLNGFLRSKSIVELSEDLIYQWKVINKYAESTIHSTKPKELRNAIEKIKINSPNTTQYLDEFYIYFYKNHIKPLKDDSNSDYAEKINTVETIKDKIKLDGELIVNWAKDIIKTSLQLPNEKINRGWYTLSLALAITSGRRMDEIHGETVHISKGITRYYKLDGEKVYINQLAKSPEYTDFKFKPIGVTSDEWLKALNKIPDTALKLLEDKVNKTVSTNISKSLKTKNGVYEQLGFIQYKDSRDFYIAYRVATEFKKNLTEYNNESDFVQSIIGHDNKASSHSYQKFVIV